jgi:DNA-binding CsgD family transcriptional regulator/N-acetylneuraminic acid mutarotase
MAAEYGEELTERELEVVEQVAQGLTNREVAERLYLSPNTIKVHLRNIFTKAGVASRTELSMMAVQEGWIEVPGAETEEEDEATSEAPAAEAAAEATEEEPPVESAGVALIPPTWSRRRWLLLGVGLVLALLVIFLPRRPARQAATAAGAKDVFQDAAEPENVVSVLEMEDGWQELPPLPVRRARIGLTAAGGRLYAIGGMTEDGVTDRLDIYDVEAATWQRGAPRPLALANASAVIVGETMVVPGGCDAEGQPVATTHLYDLAEDAWRAGADLPTAICAYAMTTYEDKVYLFGGWDGAAYRALAYAYDPASDAWTSLPAPMEARGFGAAAVLSDRIFYVGGYDGTREWNTCEAYLTEAGQWEPCAPMLQSRGGLGLAAIGGHLYAIGGGWDTYLGFNERYDPAIDSWTVRETPIVGEWFNLGVTTWETSIYVVGGWGGDYLNRTYALEVLP